ncbi:SAM-dependent methyltransferase [filamentous cyanobacterium CCP5]|nr:SAM-dependent methyltransferase [filamentous cyanobacterium CCP5]
MKPDIAFIPTPDDAIQAMVELAELDRGDRVYDLGCGDGRLLIAAALQSPCHGVGIDIDPAQVAVARQKAAARGLADRLSFRVGNLYESDVHDATVVFIYLLPHLNLRLRPRLASQLQPGARIISHQFDMGTEWPPEKVLKLVPSEEESTLYRWRV